MSNRRLVLFCSIYPSSKGERFLHNEMVYLKEAFNDIVVVTDNPNVKETKGNENVIIYEKQKVTLFDVLSFRNIQFILEILKNLLGLSFTKFKVSIKSYLNGLSYKKFVSNLIDTNQINLDETVFYTYWFNDATFGLTLLSQGSNIKYVTRVHRWDLYEEENLGNYLPFRNVVGSSIDRIFSISNDGISYLMNHYSKIRNVELSLLGVKDYGLPAENKVDDEYHTIVSCSNVIPVKRVHLIAEAIAEVKNLQIRWVHFGGGAEFSKLQSQVEEILKLNPNLEIELRGGTENDALLAFYHNYKIDLFINVSSSEGVPVSIMEAMEAGIPIMATDVGGSSEIVDARNGYLLDKDLTVVDLSNKIESHLRDAPVSQLAKKSREIFESELVASKNYDLFVDNLKSI